MQFSSLAALDQIKTYAIHNKRVFPNNQFSAADMDTLPQSPNKNRRHCISIQTSPNWEHEGAYVRVCTHTTDNLS